MAKLYFYFSAMNAGKSTVLLQASYNYRERGMNTMILLPEMDTRFAAGKVTSRIGLSSEAITFNQSDNLFSVVHKEHDAKSIHAVFVDEAQFLTQLQVRQLSDVCDTLDIPVMTYGLRTDFQGHLFEGSEHLLAWSDTLSEIRTICHCGRKATMVLRMDAKGQPVKDGRQIQIGGNERYVSVCRQHFKDGMSVRRDDELPLL
ncbi:Thymidine kinase [Novipirellula galeiformis]|uniref:Thymidine kinase n=1 Tax=Novipirellula galeiformis TaxID=2528004 RepID=A0A5C6CK16_9BACT|nr:thymidine kinase [Novipirellula galeiformis]TWU23937.1 Thymidine kinase [Novipirellula galeiformis]